MIKTIVFYVSLFLKRREPIPQITHPIVMILIGIIELRGLLNPVYETQIMFFGDNIMLVIHSEESRDAVSFC